MSIHRRPRSLFLTLAVLLAFGAGGCESVPLTKPGEPQMWELGIPVGEPNAVIRFWEGAPTSAVLKLMGEPKSKQVSDDAPAVEEWFYERRVQFGYGTQAVITQHARGTITRGQIYLEKAWLKFRDGKLVDVRTTRRREDVEIMSPFERSLRGS